jgi:hypothetical protein
VSFENIPALLPKQAVEAMGALLATPGSAISAGCCITTIDDLHRFAEMLRRGGVMEDSYHLERMAIMATLVLAAMTK